MQGHPDAFTKDAYEVDQNLSERLCRGSDAGSFFFCTYEAKSLYFPGFIPAPQSARNPARTCAPGRVRRRTAGNVDHGLVAIRGLPRPTTIARPARPRTTPATEKLKQKQHQRNDDDDVD